MAELNATKKLRETLIRLKNNCINTQLSLVDDVNCRKPWILVKNNFNKSMNNCIDDINRCIELLESVRDSRTEKMKGVNLNKYDIAIYVEHVNDYVNKHGIEYKGKKWVKVSDMMHIFEGLPNQVISETLKNAGLNRKRNIVINGEFVTRIWYKDI